MQLSLTDEECGWLLKVQCAAALVRDAVAFEAASARLDAFYAECDALVAEVNESRAK